MTLEKKSYYIGLASFLLYALSFAIGYEQEAQSSLFLLLKIFLVFLSALLFVLCYRTIPDESIKDGFALFNIAIFVYETVLLIAVGRTIFAIRDYGAIANSLFWIPATLYILAGSAKRISAWVINKFNLKLTRLLTVSAAITAFLVIILSIEPGGVRFSWDSDTLYQFIYDLDYESLYDVKKLMFYNHVSVVYSYIIVLLKLFFKDIRIAYFVLNAACTVTASFGMTFLLCRMMPDRKPSRYILANLLFMVSPWVCGMSTYHMYDYYIWCLFPLLIYYCFTYNWLGFFVTGCMITFSKSTAIVIFGSVCLMVLVTDILCYYRTDKDLGTVSIIKKLLGNVKYWYFLSVAVVFYGFFEFAISNDTQYLDADFSINLPHIIHETKVFTITNFMWIMFAAAVVFVFVFIRNRERFLPETKRVVTILLFSDLCYFIFTAVCVTYRLPRYLESHVTVVYILAALLFLFYSDNAASVLLAVTACIINLAASFISFDPVSKAVFNLIDVGDHTIVDYEMTDNPSLEDSIICNREYYSYEILLGKALTYVINDKGANDEIMFSLGNQPLTWGASGGRYSYACEDGKRTFELFYDRTLGGLANGYQYEYYDSADMVSFSIRYIFDEETIGDVLSDDPADTFYYLYMPTMNEGKENEILSNYQIIDKQEFVFRGWHMNCIKFH